MLQIMLRTICKKQTTLDDHVFEFAFLCFAKEEINHLISNGKQNVQREKLQCWYREIISVFYIQA